MHWTQIVLATSFSIYFGAAAAVMARVKRQTGANPVELTEGQRAAALLTFVFTTVSYE